MTASTSSPRHKTAHFRHYYAKQLTLTDDEMFRTIGISQEHMPPTLQCFDVMYNHRRAKGLGIRNMAGGLEFWDFSHCINKDDLRNRLSSERLESLNDINDLLDQFLRSDVSEKSLKSEIYHRQCLLAGIQQRLNDISYIKSINTITLGKPDLLRFPFIRKQRQDACCLFADLFDYVSYIYLLNTDSSIALPSRCDCLILNDVRNLVSLFVESEDYAKSYCLFPNTDFGQTLDKTICERHPCATSLSSLYSEHVSLHKFLCSKTP